MYGKRGVSGVIATILLILLSLVAIGILAGFVIPFVKENLDESTSCIKVTNELSIVREKSCYTSTKTEVGIRNGNYNLSSVYFVFDSGNEKISYEIENGM